MHSLEKHILEEETESYERNRLSEVLLQSTKVAVRERSKELLERNPKTVFEKEEPGTVIFRLREILDLVMNSSINEVKYWGTEAHKKVLLHLVHQITSRYFLEKNDEIFIGWEGIKIDVRCKGVDLKMQLEIIEMIKRDLYSTDENEGDFHLEEEYMMEMVKRLRGVARNIAEMLHVEEPLLDEIGSRYLILDEAKKGAMGKVYKAMDLLLFGKIVALKMTDFSEGNGGGVIERKTRFHREIQNQASVQHPSVAAVYRAKEGMAQGYESMEWVEGKTLQEILQQKGFIPALSENGFPGAIEIMMQIFETLMILHEQEKPRVHRDLKPSNIILTPSGQIKIVDFGISSFEKREEAGMSADSLFIFHDKERTTLSEAVRTTRDGSVVCSLPYAAPEYLAVGELRTGYDIYSAGIIFYQLLTGDLPIKESTARGIFERVTEWYYQKSDSKIIPVKNIKKEVPEKLGNLILEKMLTGAPDTRAEAREIREELIKIHSELVEEEKNVPKDKQTTRRMPNPFRMIKKQL